MPALIQPDKFQNWLLLAPRGEQMIYHTGHLAFEREKTKEFGNRVLTVAVDPEDKVGWLAYQAYRDGRVELVQRRVSENVCDYIAIMKGNRR